MSPTAGVAIPRRSLESGRRWQFLPEGCEWPFHLRKKSASQTTDSTTNLVESTATTQTNAFSTDSASGNWYKMKDPRNPSRELTASDGEFQEAGIECPLRGLPHPVRMWLDALLDTGTSDNITHETILRKYGLHDLIVKYDQPRSAQRLVVALLHRFGLARDHSSPAFVVYDRHQIPVLGEINLSIKWKEQDGTIFNDEGHSVNFKVIRAPKRKDVGPTWPLILGKKYLDDMRISVLPPPLKDDREDSECD